MRPIFVTIILIAALLAVSQYSLNAQTPEQLYQKGLTSEEGEGALQDAINLYNKVADNSNASISLRAKALMHIGMCFEKLGTNEAVKAYQRLVNNFPTQKTEVAYARERLNRLNPVAQKVTETPVKPKFTKIKIPTKLSWSVRLSPDGKNLALVSDNKLWVMPLSGNIGPDIPGQPFKLNTDSIEVEWTGLSWSGDGKWIAFNDMPSENKPGKEKSNQSIFIVPSNGGKPKKVVENYRDARVVNYRISLSPDGKNLAYSSVENNEQHIYTTKVDEGLPKQLVDIQAREPAYSPDGKMIAYVEDKDLGRGEGKLGLWIIPSKGGTPHLVADAGKASSPVWSPDGRMIAYIDYLKNKQINFVEVPDDLLGTGRVTSIDAPEGTEEVTLLAGWVHENKIGVLLTSKREFDLYTLPATGGQAAMVLHDCNAYQPRWSSDGKQIFYVTYPNEQGENKFYKGFLASIPANGGTGKPLPKNHEGKAIGQLPFQSGNRISPDGKMIISSAYTSSDTMGLSEWPNSKIWEIALEGNESRQITNKQGPYADGSPCWSPAGDKVAFIRVQLIKGAIDPYGDAEILSINSSGGEPVLLASVSGKWVNSLIWSPDGKMIAYLSQGKEAPHTKALNIIDVRTGLTRVAGEVPAAIVNTEMAWSPDSKRIAFNDRDGKVIKIINLDNGSIKDIQTGLVDVNIYHLDWSPDGERFAFGGWKGGTAEFWLLKDFLPLEKLAQKTGKENLKESEGIKIKQIWKEPYTDDLGTVSSDGRLRSYVYWGNGDVAVQNLITGESRVLTHEADLSNVDHFAQSPVISKDGSKIAYCWWNPYHTFDLHLINVDNPSPSLLLYKQEGVEVYPITWLSDKELIVIKQDRKAETTKLTSFNILDHTFRDLKTFVGRKQMLLICSPDEKFIAYSMINYDDKENSDINLLLADGNGDIPLIKHPGNDRVLGWVPGRKEFLFISDRSGTWDLWAIPLDDGKPSGVPKRIYPDIGEVSPMGFAQNGDCFVGFSRQNFNTYIAPFSVEPGELKEKEAKSMLGSNYWVKWSPDGQYLAYISLNEQQLTIQDLKTGSNRKLADNMIIAEIPCWSPDGNSIAFLGFEKSKYRTKGYKGGIYTVNVKTGQTTKIILLSDYEYNVPPDDSSPLSDIVWSSDGKSIFFLFFKDRLIKHTLETGEDKILYKHPAFERGVLRQSPDGKSLLFGLQYPGEGKSRLFTIPAEGGKEKEVCAAQEAKIIRRAYWSPDGKYIYFAENPKGTSFWRVPAEGGNPQRVWSSENNLEIFSIHPDGNQIAYATRERTTEVRVIENLVQELEKIENLNK
jgi:Tol biopolymer transport system component